MKTIGKTRKEQPRIKSSVNLISQPYVPLRRVEDNVMSNEDLENVHNRLRENRLALNMTKG